MKIMKKKLLMIACAAAFLCAGFSKYDDTKVWNSLDKSKTLTITVSGGVSIDMVYVLGGTFAMGSDDSVADFNESPIHNVTLSSYYIGKYEVTQELWTAVMGSNPSNFSGTNLPVEKVSWNDCQDFIAKLNKLTGKTFRLPTEAEWEYAARGGQKSKGYKYSGSYIIDYVAWYDGNSDNKTHAVGTKAPNELGIYDMSGNVWEWCLDWDGSYTSDAQTDPTGAASGSYRVIRGGSWDSYAQGCRCSFRYSYNPDGEDYGDYWNYGCGGLRLVLSE